MVAAGVPAFAAEPFAGRWEGSVQIPGNELVLVVDLASDSNGAWSGSITIPGMDVKGLPLKDIAVKDSDATFALTSATGRGLEAKFKAHLNENNMLSGDFTQGGNTAPFQLRQVGPPQVEQPPRSTAVTKEFEGEWQGEFQLFGYARKVSLKLANKDARGATAEFVVVGKRVNNLPVDRVAQEGDLISIQSTETGIILEGRWLKANNEMRATFSQGPIETTFTLRRK